MHSFSFLKIYPVNPASNQAASSNAPHDMPQNTFVSVLHYFSLQPVAAIHPIQNTGKLCFSRSCTAITRSAVTSRPASSFTSFIVFSFTETLHCHTRLSRKTDLPAQCSAGQRTITAIFHFYPYVPSPRQVFHPVIWNIITGIQPDIHSFRTSGSTFLLIRYHHNFYRIIRHLFFDSFLQLLNRKSVCDERF